MADYIPITEAQSDPEAAVDSSLIKRLRDNPLAIIEGSAGAPRNRPDSLDLRIADVDPAGMGSVVFTDIEPANWSLEFYTIQPDSTSNRRLLLDLSFDNGATFINTKFISEITDFRSTALFRLGGLSGFVKGSNVTFHSILTGRALSNFVMGNVFTETEDTNLSLTGQKPFQPLNAMRIRWNDGSFGADADQRIVFYQGGRRPFGGKP